MKKIRTIQLSEIQQNGTFNSNINFRSFARHGSDSCVLPGLKLTVPSRQGQNPTILEPSPTQVFTLDEVSSTEWKITLNVDSAIIVFSFKNPRATSGTYKTISY